MIVLIFVDCFAIVTPPYSKKSSLPCPICCYDFVTEQSYFDSHNRGMSLGDAAEILLNQGIPLYESSLVKDRDRLFAMRFLAYRLEIFTGLLLETKAVQAHSAMTCIDLQSLRTKNVKPIFSPACPCLQEDRYGFEAGR